MWRLYPAGLPRLQSVASVPHSRGSALADESHTSSTYPLGTGGRPNGHGQSDIINKASWPVLQGNRTGYIRHTRAATLRRGVLLGTSRGSIKTPLEPERQKRYLVMRRNNWATRCNLRRNTPHDTLSQQSALTNGRYLYSPASARPRLIFDAGDDPGRQEAVRGTQGRRASRTSPHPDAALTFNIVRLAATALVPAP